MSEHSPIVELLKSTSINELIKDKHSKIIELKSTTTVSEAIKLLAENHVLSMPVFDPMDGIYLGFLDFSDIVAFAIEMYTKGEAVKETQWGSFCTDLATLQMRGVRFGIKPVSEIMNASKRDQFIPVYGHGTLYQLMEGVFYKGIHRVPVMDEFNKIIHIVSQSDLLNFLGLHMDLLVRDIGSRSVEYLKLGAQSAITMSTSAQAIHAFYLMYLQKVSAVAIVNPSGSLIANLSASDIRGLEQQHFESLLLPVTKYISNEKGKRQGCITCTLKSDFQTVVMKMILFRIHRIWIVDENDKPIGVISQTDVMRKFAEFQDPANFTEAKRP